MSKRFCWFGQKYLTLLTKQIAPAVCVNEYNFFELSVDFESLVNKYFILVERYKNTNTKSVWNLFLLPIAHSGDNVDVEWI